MRSSGDALPTPWVRVSRRRLSVAAVVSVTALALAASQVAVDAQVRLANEIDANWRGAYDILVRPRGSNLSLDSTSGLVEPNFVALSGQGGITEAEVDAIRAIPGVEIAAPIGWVGLLSSTTTAPTIEVTTFPLQPTLYSVSLTLSTSDGLGPRLIFHDSVRVLLAAGSKGQDP